MTNCLFSLGEVAVTAEMTVRYLRPTRLDLEATLVGQLRRTAWPLHYVFAELRQEGTALVRAEGKFVDRGAAG